MMGNTRHKDDDGWYHYQVSGTLGKPRFRPSAAAARRGKRKPPTTRKAPSADERDEEEDASLSRSNNPNRVDRPSVSKGDREDAELQREQLREERAQRREERKERREEMMPKRRERQDELGQRGGSIPTLDNDAFVLPDDIMPTKANEEKESEYEPGEGELENDGPEELEGERGDYEQDE